MIPDDFFKYIYHVECAIKVHSIITSGLIPGGQNLSKRQTVFFLLVSPMDKEHKDPETIDLEAPRLAWYMHTAWKKHQNTVYWVDIKLAQKERFLSSVRRDRTPSSFTIHSQPVVSRKPSGWKLKKSYTKKYIRHLDLRRRFPSKTIG